MKSLQLSLVSLLCLVLLFSCEKEKEKEPEYSLTLPDSVEIGASVIFLNGTTVDYGPVFYYDSFYHYIWYDFFKKTPNLASVGFIATAKSGTFSLVKDECDLLLGDEYAIAGFGHVNHKNLEGYSYELMDADEGFFKVEALDTAKMVAKGRYKVKFRRTSKNGNKENLLPKFLIFEGVFHDKYTFDQPQ